QTAARQVWPSDGATTTPLASLPSLANRAVQPAAPAPFPTTPPDSYPALGPSLAPEQAPQRIPTQFASSQVAPLGRPPAGPPAVAPGAPATTGTAPTLEALRPSSDEPDQYLNQLQLDFDYNVHSMGAAGIARVELWTTTDNGAQ